MKKEEMLEKGWKMDEAHHNKIGSEVWKDSEGVIRWGKYVGLHMEIFCDEKGNRHRLDGPAIILYTYDWKVEDSTWFYHGKEIKCSTQQEFEKLLKLKAFW